MKLYRKDEDLNQFVEVEALHVEIDMDCCTPSLSAIGWSEFESAVREHSRWKKRIEELEQQLREAPTGYVEANINEGLKRLREHEPTVPDHPGSIDDDIVGREAWVVVV